MQTTKDALLALRHELEFLDNGGYRMPIGHRQPLFCMETSTEWKDPAFFEDSPICPKKRYGACAAVSDCLLRDFVPIERQQEPVPCRHLLLNEKGETIESLYRTGTRQEMEASLRNWLLGTIERFEKQTPQETSSGSEEAA